jgi:acyl-coenzyme A synthetase/AMP-(fatty) acid ligase
VAVVAGASALDADAILAFARERLSGVKSPKAVHVWPELPKSGANKILRRVVRETLLAQEGTPA